MRRGEAGELSRRNEKARGWSRVHEGGGKSVKRACDPPVLLCVQELGE